MIAGVAAIAMALIPGMPPHPVHPRRRRPDLRLPPDRRPASSSRRRPGEAEATAQNFPEMDPNEKLLEDMRVHPVEILLAPDLVDMVSGASDDLLARVRSLRHKIAMELGLVIPPVRTRDSVDLPPPPTRSGSPASKPAAARAPSGQMLALGDNLDSLPGTAMIEPVFGLAGKWIPGGDAPQRRDDRCHGDRPGLRPRHPPVLDRHRRTPPGCSPARTSAC